MTHNMTEGNPGRLILRFAVPLILGNLFQQFYSMADTMIVGRTLGYRTLAAVGAAGNITFMLLGFVLGFTMGATIPVAQRFGAGDIKNMRREVGTAIILTTTLTVLITALSLSVAMPLLKLMNTPDDVITEAYKYITIIFSGVAATAFYNLIANIFRALGDSRTPLIFLVVSSALNIILDLLLICVFKMGVRGAGVATVTAQLVSGLLCLMVVAKKLPDLHLERKDFELSGRRIKRQLALSVPMGLQLSVTGTGLAVLQSALNGFGSEVMAGFTAAASVDVFAAQGIYALSSAMATYTAQNFGAGRYDRVRKGAKWGVLLGLSAATLGMLFMFIPGMPIAKLFIDNQTDKILESVRIFFIADASFYWVLALLCVMRNVLQGMGKSVVPLLGGGIELVMRAVAALVLARFIGYLGICLAAPIAWFGAMLPMVVTYLWHSSRLPKTSV